MEISITKIERQKAELEVSSTGIVFYIELSDEPSTEWQECFYNNWYNITETHIKKFEFDGKHIIIWNSPDMAEYYKQIFSGVIELTNDELE